MTQIISLATPRYTLQVSDRLVSKRQPRKPLTPHDQKFNKHVLFAAKNALVTIGFSGLAYLEGIPTDQWIAAVLTNEQPSAPQGGPGLGTKFTHLPSGALYPPNWPDIGSAIKLLQERLSIAFRDLGAKERQSGLNISIVGWQWKWHWSQGDGTAERLRPICCKIWYDQRSDFLTELSARYWGWEKNGLVVQATPKLPTDILDSLVTQLSSPPRDILTDDVAEMMMIQAIREVSQTPERGVGQDLLAVSINMYRDPVVKILYRPQVPMGEFYTGWIVTPLVVQPPQVIAVSPGTSTRLQSGPFSVVFEGPASSQPGWAASSSTQPRKQPP